ncbi:MAG: hypothetical protein QNJ91_01445 [Gammaproteobacteria bacterium]|nr:hypothetical protein [Gammaproteobacteria bacterium]
MDTLALFSLPGFAVMIALAAVAAWIGHSIGRNNEEQRKRHALDQVERTSKQTIAELESENQKKLDVLNKANSNEMDVLKQSHTQQIDQLNTAHQAVVDSLKSGHASDMERIETEHSGLIDRLNSSNNANISELEKRRHDEMQALRSEQQQTLAALRSDHATAVKDLQLDRDRRLQEAEQRNADERARLDVQLTELRTERDTLAARNGEIGQELADLRKEIKEAQLNNMFSVSKSGEKLIRVVRSVQELASELDETSRTVTGGEYSFFEQIKDQRDRETVLSLAASGQADAGNGADDDHDDASTIARADDDTGDAPTAH